MRCNRVGCQYKRHPDINNNNGTHCCLACKTYGTHGPLCKKETFQPTSFRKMYVSNPKIDKSRQMILAYYFPQYHSIPENDMVFGKNFTDWNCFTDKSSEALKNCKFPLEPPAGLGYYDPTLVETRERQGNLAKKYGVDGFIYYHYWLENKPVMSTVLDNLINDNQPDLPFCLCFANENWIHNYRPVNGEYKSFHPNGITFRQLYNNPIEHAAYLQKIFTHPNYIKIDDRPVLFLYRLSRQASHYLQLICNELKKYNINHIFLIVNISMYCIHDYKGENLAKQPDAISPFAAHPNMPPIDLFPNIPISYAGLIGWNNTVRHPSSKRKIIDNNPDSITRTVSNDLLKMKQDARALQIYSLFAWNEWAEGATIEPNSFYGENLGYAIKKARDIVEMA